MRRLFRRFQYWLHQRRHAAELAEELEYHRARKRAELEARGLSPEVARREAARALGNELIAREDARAVWISRWLDTTWQDVRNGMRMLRRDPWLSIVVALTLALGVGMNATAFGLMDALLLRPFQFQDVDRIVLLREVRRGSAEREAVAPANFLDWQAQSNAFERLSAWEPWAVDLTGGSEAQRIQGARVGPGFFELLGVSPAAGRPFAAEDHEPGNNRRVLISDILWKQRFGAAPGVVGTEMQLDGQAYTIVGIMPQYFDFPLRVDVWTPLALPPARAASRDERTLTVIGKLAPGVPLERARTELDVIGRRLADTYPASNRDRQVVVETLTEAYREAGTLGLVSVLQSGALLVLFVGCANLVGLLLSRAVERRRELAVRTALGAGRLRLVRQIVTETMMLGLLASVFALALTAAGINVLHASLSADAARYIEGWNNLRLDTRLAVLVPVFACLAGVLVGIAPAVSASRQDLVGVLKDGERGASGPARQRGRQALVVAEIAFALAALVAAGLSIGAGMRMINQPGGFNPSRLLTVEILLPNNRYEDADARRTLTDTLLERLRAIPGASDATVANVLPAAGWSPSVPYSIDDQPLAEGSIRPVTGFQAVSAGYFETLEIPILRGRALTAQDREGTQPVAVISDSLANAVWPGQDPIGRRLRLENENSSRQWLTVVGVAGDVTMYNWWDGVDYTRLYVPVSQIEPPRLLQVAVRSGGRAEDLAGSLRAAIRGVDPTLIVQNVRTMEDRIAQSGQGLQFLAGLLSVCGGLAALLAAIGIYGTMAYAVSQRTHEFGIRMALGATAYDLLALTLRQAGTLTVIGLATGSALAVLFGWGLSSALFGVVSLDARTFALVAAGLAVVSLFAAYLPARRTLRLDVARVLRA
ncbi:MAG TPA: ABC transporter permease [Vicinamibacterales bacterium]